MDFLARGHMLADVSAKLRKAAGLSAKPTGAVANGAGKGNGNGNSTRNGKGRAGKVKDAVS